MSSKFLVYQIDFSAVAAGKRVSSSKRKIRWRFGFASQQSLDEGKTGTDCRGDEHEVAIVWSITSGKRQISMDGHQVHYSTNRASMLDFSWQSKGNHFFKVVCHAAPPMSVEPGFRQYDLLIDGLSFFTMPKVFQIGIKGAIPNNLPVAHRSNPISPVSMGSSNLSRDIPVTREQEDEDLRRAIQASIKESQRHLGEIPNNAGDRTSYSSAAGAEANLLEFNGPPAESRSVASMPSYYSAPTTYGQGNQSPAPPAYPAPAPLGGAAGALVPAVAPPGYYQAAPAPVPPTYMSPPPPQHAYSSPPPVPPAPASTPATTAPSYGSVGAGDIFGLHTTPRDDPFAPKAPPPPTHEDLASAILASYQSPVAGATQPHTPMAGGYDNHGDTTTPGTPQTNGTDGKFGAHPGLSMNALAITSVEEKPKSEFEKALINLVNIDHIDEPAEGEIKLTMMMKEEAKKTPKDKSVPKPPVGSNMVGSHVPLSKIKQDFPSHENNNSEGIMNAPPPGVFHPNAANGGALVVHGQGPPPLHQVHGFGVGQMLPNGGFQNQQNLAPGQYATVQSNRS